MAKVYKSICLEIDTLALEIIHLTEKLINCKLEVENVMNTGFVNIAKSRYIMGSKCVSTLQLPTAQSNPIHPLVTVCRFAHGQHWVYKSTRRKPTSMQSDGQIFEGEIDCDVSNREVIKEMLGTDSKNLRKRKDFFLVEDECYKELNDDLQDELSTDSAESADSLVSFTDPIRLFGVLVPTTLRVAQKNFQDAVEVLINCATIQSETNAALERFQHLYKVKKLIEAAAEERNLNLNIQNGSPTSDGYSESDLTTDYVLETSPPEFSIQSNIEASEEGAGYEIGGKLEEETDIPIDSAEDLTNNSDYSKSQDEAYEKSKSS